MKTKSITQFFLLLTACAQLSVFAQGTAITYQGRLSENYGPANGSYDFTFQVFDAPTGGTSRGGPLTTNGVAVTDGLVSVTLDFGAAPFSAGAPRWLEIQVRPAGAGTFTTLSPRQALTATPYAITAGTLTGPVGPSSLSGTYGGAVSFTNQGNSFSGDGGGLTNINATTLGGISPANVWQTGGNYGANSSWYLGTADYQPLELRVNKTLGFRLLPTLENWPNAILGASNNVISADVTGASIGGGVNNSMADTCGSAFIGGGRNNLLQFNAAGSVIGGGQWNVIGDGSVRSVISGGYSNTIGGFTSTNAASIARDITDGTSNTILLGETPPGSATIGGGYLNRIGQDCTGAVIGGGEEIGLGDGSVRSVVAGGSLNQIGLAVHNGAISGGWNNAIGDNANYATIPGGAQNYVSGAYSFAAGRRARAIHAGAFVWADSLDADFPSAQPNEFCVRADGSVRFITAGAGMTLDGQPVLAGSNGSLLTNLNASSLSTGTVPDTRLSSNVALCNASNIFTASQAITGGSLGIGTTNPLAPLHVNTPIGVPSGLLLTSGGSWPFSLTQTPSSVMVISNGGVGRIFMPSSGNVGFGNADPLHKLHVGTYGTVLTVDNSPVKAVVENTNENGRATLVAVAGPGSTPNTTNRVEVVVEADEGLRAGLLGTTSAHALEIRVANTTRLFVSTNGNVGIGTTAPTNALHVAGGVSAMVFVSTSDRNAKENFEAVSPAQVLDKVTALPITRWTFKEMPGQKHLGPMAQDFHAAFDLGAGDTSIATVDESGVALAAIQGLNQKVEAQRAELQARDQRIKELESRLARMERLLFQTPSR